MSEWEISASLKGVVSRCIYLDLMWTCSFGSLFWHWLTRKKRYFESCSPNPSLSRFGFQIRALSRKEMESDFWKPRRHILPTSLFRWIYSQITFNQHGSYGSPPLKKEIQSPFNIFFIFQYWLYENSPLAKRLEAPSSSLERFLTVLSVVKEFNYLWHVLNAKLIMR